MVRTCQSPELINTIPHRTGSPSRNVSHSRALSYPRYSHRAGLCHPRTLSPFRHRTTWGLSHQSLYTGTSQGPVTARAWPWGVVVSAMWQLSYDIWGTWPNSEMCLELSDDRALGCDFTQRVQKLVSKAAPVSLAVITKNSWLASVTIMATTAEEDTECLKHCFTNYLW